MNVQPATRADGNPAARAQADARAEEALRRAEAWLARVQQRRRLDGEHGCLSSVTEWGGGRSSYRYDVRGDLVEIEEPDGRRSAYVYDRRRRLTEVSHADGGRTCYAYGDNDRLAMADDRGLVRTYRYDDAGRLERVQHGKSGTAVLRYGDCGRIALARTSRVTTKWRYDAAGNICDIEQALDGTALRVHLDYDPQGRLWSMTLHGLESRVQYAWDEDGKQTLVRLGGDVLAHIDYLPDQRAVHVRLGNGLHVERVGDPVDGRPVRYDVRRGDACLFRRAHTYGACGVTHDGVRAYEYDPLERLLAARDVETGATWRYTYDAMDNCVISDTDGRRSHYRYDLHGRLLRVDGDDAVRQTLSYDARGRLQQRSTALGVWTYRYDDTDALVEVRRDGQRLARFVYDHKGLLVCAIFADRVERYLYGPSDELLMVTDGEGRLRRAFIYTPMGLLAEVRVQPDGSSAVRYAHTDTRGTLHAWSDGAGRIAETFAYSPFGVPLAADGLFGGHVWVSEVGLYYCRARWYDPQVCRFITPDTYTGAPDDERLMLPVRPASRQAGGRAHLLGDWLKQPRVRNCYVYCGNDPVGRVDPNGHWSAGWVILSVLGAIWTLPNTLLGLAIEITCLLLEAVRWVLFGITFGNFDWEGLKPPGFDAAASGRLNAFAIVFTGGWIGSFEGLLGITFGNVFFVNPDWEQHPELGGPGDVFPSAYNGEVALPRREALYEHELRHVNHQSWIGPFYYLGLPIWGFFFWDLMFNGYCNMWSERDARSRAGV